MNPKLLLTSFDIWLTHHKSNASDDLLELISQHPDFIKAIFLRKLPVDFDLAPAKLIAKLKQTTPDIVVCCGMAESRTKLTVESRATNENNVLLTAVNLEQLVADLPSTEISHEAGKFVCEALYYSALNELQKHPSTPCIFVHVPVLTKENTCPIFADFVTLLHRLKLSYQPPQKYA
ncbi:peptidase C15 [Ancylothrix sp. C2]|uniref:pyroglutamyl-peptidase I family protein n=1 Tax=Ancylothrix sp. D3o TaxID=2953691 RepID=UPI0021BAFCEA|nr:peptidase C15 [Ancylothrix sp. D3o]MCT7952423.1 peptidase C15 [Ancylothrix sp. D3o]